ncbi:SRPBCC domain-containing protein [Chloroflexota bacterium]
MPEQRNVSHEVVIDTTPEMAFEALTEGREMREWFCDEAWTQVRPGGRYDIRWNQGYRADGTFTELDPPHRATVEWQGSGEPDTTTLAFVIEPAGTRRRVTVVHDGFGAGTDWDEALAQAERGWSVGLQNLKSTLETGVDLRVVRQPFLGISFDLLTPERAAREGIAAERGIYVLGTLEDSGARRAGVEQGDVIVALGGIETSDYETVREALRTHCAGDVVELDMVRGQIREARRIELGQRPQVEVPGSARALADRLAEQLEAANAELSAALEDVTEQEADHKPAPGEWSAKEVLAHLSAGERGLHFYLVGLAVNGWLDAGGIDPDAFPGQLVAVLASAPTVEALRARFFTDEQETVTLLRGLPNETVAHKARFRRICEAVQYSPDHVREHVTQIVAALESVRGS